MHFENFVDLTLPGHQIYEHTSRLLETMAAVQQGPAEVKTFPISTSNDTSLTRNDGWIAPQHK